MSAKLEAVHPVLMVRSVSEAIRFYGSLGFVATFTDAPEPKYAAVVRDGIELHLQWHDAEEWTYPNDRPTYRFVVDDVDALSFELDARAFAFDRTPVKDTTWGTREFHVRDPDGNGLQFYRDRSG